MKRALFETIKVLPYTSGGTVDRTGFLSARLGLLVTGAGDLKFTVQHSDDGVEFEQALDTRLFLGETRVPRDPDGHITGVYAAVPEVEADDELQLDIDLLGCKQFVQIVVAGAATATLALALGDPADAPVR